jgi:hypothetical protein
MIENVSRQGATDAHNNNINKDNSINGEDGNKTAVRVGRSLHMSHSR